MEVTEQPMGIWEAICEWTIPNVNAYGKVSLTDLITWCEDANVVATEEEIVAAMQRAHDEGLALFVEDSLVSLKYDELIAEFTKENDAILAAAGLPTSGQQ